MYVTTQGTEVDRCCVLVCGPAANGAGHPWLTQALHWGLVSLVVWPAEAWSSETVKFGTTAESIVLL